jgi:superfamily II DNA or RNA helicase
MSKKSTSTVFGMPFRKNPRAGQTTVFERVINDPSLKSLNVQLPTGYGKSFVNAGVYSILKKQNRVNRLLVIVPRDAQNDQYEKDGPIDLNDACVDGNLVVNDVRFGGVQSLKHHRNGTRQVFVLTVQSLLGRSGDIIREMLKTGNWMVTVDEYHHYGIDKAWGQVVTSLPYVFLLALSATPHRPSDDSAFGKPDIVVSYREAAKQGCLKPLVSHSYIYQIDAIINGDIISYTTDDLISEVGSDSPDAIERYKIEKKMRWSPKYISPLVTHPIERMHNERLKTGYKLQAVIGAMCVSHAKMVCEQIETLYPELSVDWVGTGNNGRSPVENKAIIEKFCPPKDKLTGQRSPTLDVLVHVGMAGEGLDSVNVSEVVHLNKASINNSNNQENGRAARFLEGVSGHINFDSCSEYATCGYIGEKIMDAMDCLPPNDEVSEEIKERNESEYEPIPTLKTHYQWVKNLEREILETNEVPLWVQ